MSRAVENTFFMMYKLIHSHVIKIMTQLIMW